MVAAVSQPVSQPAQRSTTLSRMQQRLQKKALMLSKNDLPLSWADPRRPLAVRLGGREESRASGVLCFPTHHPARNGRPLALPRRPLTPTEAQSSCLAQRRTRQRKTMVLVAIACSLTCLPVLPWFACLPACVLTRSLTRARLPVAHSVGLTAIVYPLATHRRK